MADLARIFHALGCEPVRTYIQSGNVIFGAPASLVARLPALVARALAEGHGLQSPVVLRSAAELRAAVDGNPFPGAEGVHLAFLADRPGAAAVRRLDPKRSPGDRFAVRGRDIYLHLPNGAARTRLTNDYLDRALSTVSTVRNWNTVEKLLALATEG